MDLESALTFSFLVALLCCAWVWFVLMMLQFRRRHRNNPTHPLQVTTDTVVRVFVYDEEDATTTPQSDTPPPRQCCICADLPANVRLQPCNHHGLCYACAMRIWSYDSRCPFCRVHFTGILFRYITEE